MYKKLSRVDEMHKSIYNSYFYEDVSNEHLSVEKQVIILSKIITIILDNYTKFKLCNNEEKKKYIRDSKLKKYNRAILTYVNTNNADDVLKCMEEIRQCLAEKFEKWKKENVEVCIVESYNPLEVHIEMDRSEFREVETISPEEYLKRRNYLNDWYPN